MIEYIHGTIADLTPTYAVIDCGGIGYLLNISLPTFTRLEGSTSAKLLAHEVIREDAHVLFGFIDEQERSLFRLLIGVSGVGANTARMILSSIAAPELEIVISTGDATRLKNVKGIGAKTAQRIIVDLKDKIKTVGSTLVSSMPQVSATYEEAVAALSMLGFSPQASQKVVQKLLQDMPGIRVEEVIKQALKML